MKVLRYIEGETASNKLEVKFLEKKLEELNERLLQWFGHARRVSE
jgi:hypothetical protein